MNTFSRYLAIFFAWMLGISETWLFMLYDEYWPLSFYHYFGVVLMLWCSRSAHMNTGVVFLSVGWGFVTGSLYALLLTVYDSTINSNIQLTVLGIAFGISCMGLISSLLASHHFFSNGRRLI
ncbi:MAG: hypothetical protein HAW62_05540 [Endozoicomonadaceae bacterium]|nr:hypothetical protein [Endozoicomonadaceae bacterium]